MLCEAVRKGPGPLESYINSRKLSSKSPQVDSLRRKVVRAAEVALGPHAQVQMQGSAFEAVALAGTSDADFYVHLPSSAAPVTRAQRVLFAQALAQAPGVATKLRRNRVRGVFQCPANQGPEVLEFDVVFSRFALDERLPPLRRTLDAAVQLSVCALKLMPGVGGL